MEPTTSTPRASWTRWLRGSALVLSAIVAIAAVMLYYAAADLIARRLRPATIQLLEDRFDSEVELAALEVGLAPTLQIRGRGLVLRHRGRRDIPPLITIRSFTIESSLRELWSRHLQRVHLEGLEIMIPPRRGEDMPRLPAPRPSSRDGHSTRHEPSGSLMAGRPDVYIHELVSESGLLTLMSKRAGKRPRVFQLRRLRFPEFEFGRATPFHAAITNPVPAGEIAVAGTFGPWYREEPSLTPVDGSFQFDADLATIKGIGGTLRAAGTFGGPLEYIRTTGRTQTTGFHLSSGGAKFPLHADYVAIVDGTNGDTHLESVDARLGESRITARGEIVHVEGVKGRRITLETTTTGGRLEDFIKLTTRVDPSPMTGLIDLRAKLNIPPGDDEVLNRMDLEGAFDVRAARFTSQTIQNRVDELSRRGIGRPKDEKIDDVLSNFRGSFRLNDATMGVRSLTFAVRGAEVRLAGSYAVETERLDFRGSLRLEASASRTQTGWKSIVLKVFDPLLRRDGAGTLLPIEISGTRNDPQFKVDFKKAILRR